MSHDFDPEVEYVETARRTMRSLDTYVVTAIQSLIVELAQNQLGRDAMKASGLVAAVLWELHKGDLEQQHDATPHVVSVEERDASLSQALRSVEPDDLRQTLAYISGRVAGAAKKGGFDENMLELCRELTEQLCLLHTSHAQEIEPALPYQPDNALWERLYKRPQDEMGVATHRVMIRIPLQAKAELRGILFSMLQKEIFSATGEKEDAESISREITEGMLGKGKRGDKMPDGTSTVELQHFVRKTPVADWRFAADHMRLILERRIVGHEAVPPEYEAKLLTFSERLGSMLAQKLYDMHPEHRPLLLPPPPPDMELWKRFAGDPQDQQVAGGNRVLRGLSREALEQLSAVVFSIVSKEVAESRSHQIETAENVVRDVLGSGRRSRNGSRAALKMQAKEFAHSDWMRAVDHILLRTEACLLQPRPFRGEASLEDARRVVKRLDAKLRFMNGVKAKPQRPSRVRQDAVGGTLPTATVP